MLTTNTKSALKVALDALNNSEPTHKHYQEPIARHNVAIELVTDALSSKLVDFNELIEIAHNEDLAPRDRLQRIIVRLKD